MKKFAVIVGTYLAPFAVLAQGTTGTQTRISDVLLTFTGLLNLIPPILLALAIIYFMFGLVTYILNSSKDSGNRSEAIEIMIWGGIAIFVMVTITSIIRIVQNTFGVTGRDPIEAPTVRPR